MARKANKGNGNDTVYAMVTERMVAALERGTVPWTLPWVARANVNASTGYAYRGINRLLLAMAQEDAALRGEEWTNLWLTYKQAQALGGNVRKGEGSTVVVLWKPCERKTGERNDDGTPATETYFLLRYFRVFNLAQTEGCKLPAKVEAQLAQGRIADDSTDDTEAEAVWAAWADKPAEELADGACYRPSTDTMGMPARADFHSVARYWGARFHEGVHATGHASRLARPGLMEVASFGSCTYSKEELVAELGASFLLARTGLLHDNAFDQSAAYVASWLKALQDDPRMVVTAAGAAEKAARLIAPEPGEAVEPTTSTALAVAAPAPLARAAA